MSGIQPGTGFNLSASSSGTTLNIDPPFLTWSLEDTHNSEITLHPYQVINANASTFQVVPGTFNNLPTMKDGTQGATPVWLTDTPAPDISWNWNATTNKSYVYLVGGPNTTTHVYPSPDTTTAAYPGVGSWDSPTTDSNSYSYLMLAEATIDPTTSQVVVTQYVTGSIWSDRIKIGDQTARYYHARI